MKLLISFEEILKSICYKFIRGLSSLISFKNMYGKAYIELKKKQCIEMFFNILFFSISSQYFLLKLSFEPTLVTILHQLVSRDCLLYLGTCACGSVGKTSEICMKYFNQNSKSLNSLQKMLLGKNQIFKICDSNHCLKNCLIRILFDGMNKQIDSRKKGILI